MWQMTTGLDNTALNIQLFNSMMILSFKSLFSQMLLQFNSQLAAEGHFPLQGIAQSLNQIHKKNSIKTAPKS